MKSFRELYISNLILQHFIKSPNHQFLLDFIYKPTFGILIISWISHLPTLLAKCFHILIKCFTKMAKCFTKMIKCLQKWVKNRLKWAILGINWLFLFTFWVFFAYMGNYGGSLGIISCHFAYMGRIWAILDVNSSFFTLL